jgi:protein disulfide-isomerase A1
LAVCVHSAEQKVLAIDSTTFDDVVAHSEVLMVNFFAPWCGHCKNMEKDLQIAAKALATQESVAKIVSVDTSLAQNSELVEKFDIDGYPTLVVFKDGARLPDYTGSRDAR